MRNTLTGRVARVAAVKSRMKKKLELEDLKQEVKNKRARFEELADLIVTSTTNTTELI